MNMQREADYGITNSALFYSDSFENHGFPSALGEAMIGTFGRDHSSSVWTNNTLSAPDHFSSYQDVAPFSYPFDSPKTVITANSDYTFEAFAGTTTTRLNEWVSRGEENIISSINFRKDLSLSLATSQPCSDITSSHVGSDNTSCSSNSLSLNFNSYKPQPSPILSGSSTFLHAMQQILAQLSYYALQDFDHSTYGLDHDASFSSSSSSRLVLQNRRDVESNKKHLLSLLQMVYLF